MSHCPVSPVFVGRHAEIDRLQSLIERAAGGHTEVATVAGEAGVGKSRLLGEGARLAAARGFRVLGGGCVELGGEAMPLAPLADVLRGLTCQASPAELDRLLGPARREFARLLPDLDPAVPTGDAPVAQLLEHVLGLIRRLVAERPLLLIIEDLHWADQSTRDMVVFLVRRLRDLPVLLLLSYRSDELHRRHPLRPLVACWERSRSACVLQLRRFGRAEVDAQLRAIRDQPSDARLTDLVFDRSQGNAYLVEEILAAVEGGADPGDLPPSLRDVLLARSESVSEPAQQVLRAAAAAGPRVADRLLAGVAGLTGADLQRALREVVEHHLLVVDDGGHGYAFRHELTREALYDDLLPGERVQLHAAYGEALSADPGLLGDDAGVAATLAHHWSAALDLPRALAASVQAGRQAAAAYAPAKALCHLERALQLWPRVPDAEQRAALPWPRLCLLAAEAAWGAGAPHRALALVDQAGTEEIELTRWRARILRALGRSHEAVTEMRDALARLPDHPLTTAHADLLATLANALMLSDQTAEAASVARRAVAAATAAGSVSRRADALLTLGTVLAYDGGEEAGLAALREGVALAERYGLPEVGMRAHINLSDVQTLLGRYAEAAETAATGLALAERIGHTRSSGALLTGNLAEAWLRGGRWHDAAELITRSLAAEPTDVFAGALLLLRAELWLGKGDADAAAVDLQAATRELAAGRSVQYRGPLAYGRAELARLRGEPAAVRRHLAEVLSRPIGGMWSRYAWPLAWLDARAAADTRDGELTPVALPARTRPAQAFQALTAAELARRERTDEVDAWTAAVTATRAATEAYPLAYALFRLAEAHCAQSRPDRATAAAAAAECSRLSEQLRSVTADDVRALAAGHRLDIGSPAPSHRIPAPTPAPAAGFRLTGREREVLALVAEGRTNGQIASRLVISTKTASVHVSNILAKLEVASRTEAATVAFRRGLLAS
ncbi:ATP-binding protein [Actinoplanes subtropicus]|uniref:ATP-binding protein n=1 Tax=Actinoplanes subtropicus TaxID=543632 RepID=UPI0004C3DD9B|nr:helix-turn-helix transcriptional regulator [Actinoplanes subtropicus]